MESVAASAGQLGPGPASCAGWESILARAYRRDAKMNTPGVDGALGQALSSDAAATLDACLAFCCDRGDVFEEWERQTLFGESLDETRALARGWRTMAPEPSTVGRLLGYVGSILSYPGALDAFGSSQAASLAELERQLLLRSEGVGWPGARRPGEPRR